EVGQLPLGGAAGVADDGEPFPARAPARPADLRLDGAGHDPEERVGDVVDEDADEVGRGGGQGAGGTVEDVVEFVDRFEDALPGGRGHRIVAVQYARHRRGGDLRTGRHVRQGHRHVSSSASCASSYAAVRRRPHRVPGPPGPRLRPDDRAIRRVVRPLEQAGLAALLSPVPRGGRMLPARKALAVTSLGPRPPPWSAGQLVSWSARDGWGCAARGPRTKGTS